MYCRPTPKTKALKKVYTVDSSNFDTFLMVFAALFEKYIYIYISDGQFSAARCVSLRAVELISFSSSLKTVSYQISCYFIFRYTLAVWNRPYVILLIFEPLRKAL